MAALLAGCREVPRYFEGSRLLAEAGGEKLRLRDVRGVAPVGLAGADSAAFMEQWVDRWVVRQLKLAEAEDVFSRDEEDIDSLVEEYRQGLLIRRYDQRMVEQADTTITDAQVEAYYRAHTADFRSAQTWVKGLVVRYPDGSRQARRVRDLMLRVEARDELREVAEKNRFEFTDHTGAWVPWSEFLALLPTLRSRDYDDKLTAGPVQRMSDGRSGYYFRLTDIVRQGGVEPLEVAAPTVRRILWNQRQGEIIREHEQRLYRAAEERGRVEIYPAEE